MQCLVMTIFYENNEKRNVVDLKCFKDVAALKILAKNINLIYFFLNDVCQIANLPKLFVMVKWLLNKSANAHFWVFLNEIFHQLM